MIEPLDAEDLLRRLGLAIKQINVLEQQLAERDRTIARMQEPISDDEWLNLCAGDHIEYTEIQRRDLDAIVAARAKETKC